MITQVQFLSLDAFKRLRPSLDTAVISILDESERSQRPRLTGFRSVLELRFEDTWEELKLATPGGWPDEPSDAQHAVFCQGRGERVPAMSDARRVVDFVTMHHRSADTLKLVVHCFAGMSRSPAVASWVGSHFFIPVAASFVPEGANPRITRLLHSAASSTPSRLN